MNTEEKLRKKVILIITGRYLPGYKDGGPVRSIKNLVDCLGEEYQFRILTCDRDHGDTQPYPNVKVNEWNQVGDAQVYYVKPKGFSGSVIRSLSVEADLLYVCGCFSDYAIQTLVQNRLRRISCPVVVAAMGLFSPKAFRLKYGKKKLFTMLFQMTGMFRNIYWSATSELEISEIKQQIIVKDNYFIAGDLPRKVDETPVRKEKEVGRLKVVWISRIVPKKNLLQAIRILQKVRSEVDFTIYGPLQEEAYWKRCEAELNRLPANICWKWAGMVASEDVVDTLKQHHVFLFPTLGENYGHVIQEALSAGCGIVLSDQTPWKQLEEHGVGYVYPVEAVDDYCAAIEGYAAMNQSQFQEVADRAQNYAAKCRKERIKDTGYRRIFEKLTEVGEAKG